MQLQVARYIKQDLKVLNSFDTWHSMDCQLVFFCSMLLLKLLIIGTKNVAKELTKLTKDRVRDKGVTWFPELVDKRE